MVLPSFLWNLPNLNKAIRAIQRGWIPGGINNIIATNNLLKAFPGRLTRSAAGAVVSALRPGIEAGVNLSNDDPTDDPSVGDIPSSPRFRGTGFGERRFKYIVLMDLTTPDGSVITIQSVIESDQLLSEAQLEDRILRRANRELRRYVDEGTVGEFIDQLQVPYTIMGVFRTY